MMKKFDVVALKEFYAAVSRTDGILANELSARADSLFALPRSPQDLDAYRLARKPWKKLSDEIMPVLGLMEERMPLGRVRFPLDNEPPDAWVMANGSSEPVGVEVTFAQGTGRYHAAAELVATGIGPGYVGLTDDADPAQFAEVMKRGRVMHSTEAVLTTVKHSVRLSLSKKDKATMNGFILLIVAPMHAIPRERWKATEAELALDAAATPFSEVYVQSERSHPWSLRIK